MNKIPVKEAETVAWDIGKAAVTGGIGAVVGGTPGAVVGTLIGGLMAKDKNVKIFVVGTSALALLGIFTGVVGNVIGGNAGDQ